jgi:protein-disulfide isomerase
MRAGLLFLVLACCAENPPAAAQEAPASAAPAAIVATWSGGSLTAAELDPLVADEVARLETEHALAVYDTKMQALESAIIDKLLEAEASKRGLPGVDALIQAEVVAKAAAPTQEDLDGLWAQASAQYPGVTREQIGPFLDQEARRRNEVDRYGVFIEELERAYGLAFLLPYPELPRVDVAVLPTDPSRGPADAPVTIVQFMEYQCYYCNKALPTVEKIVEAYGDKVRVVYKDSPLPGHERAMPAAIAARCAAAQGKHTEMHRVLLGNQDALGDADLLRHAKAIGVDTKVFERCMTNPEHVAAIQADVAAGQAAGVNATPTFLVNGLTVAGAQPFSRFAAVIDNELARR